MRSFISKSMQQQADSSEEMKDRNHDMYNRMQHMENQNAHLWKVIHHLQLEHKAILKSVQNIQAGVNALLHYCGLQLHQPVSSTSNLIQIDEEDDTTS